jgi:predicted HNH restriction endonuclease
MNTWIIQLSPSRFDVEAYVSQNIYISLTVNNLHKKKLQIGDIIYVWRSQTGSMYGGGIIAKCIMHDDNMAEVLEYSITEKFIKREMLQKHPVLKGLEILRMYSKYSYLLSKSEAFFIHDTWKMLMLNDNKDGVPEQFDVLDYPKSDEELTTEVSMEDLQRIAEGGKNKPAAYKTLVTEYKRNPFIALYVKKKADGVCQLCENTAPFHLENKEPYLEVHHIKWLSQGGEDSINNAVALCPNCHRKMHSLNLKEDIKILKLKASSKY